MKYQWFDDRLEIKDNPTLFWLFYSLFIFGGGVALLMGIFHSDLIWRSILVSIIGCGSIIGGLYMLKREPASRINIDLGSQTVDIKRWGIFGTSHEIFPLGELIEARLDTKEHSEGGNIFRPMFRLNDGSNIPISYFWYQTDADSNKVVGEVDNAISRIVPKAG